MTFLRFFLVLLVFVAVFNLCVCTPLVLSLLRPFASLYFSLATFLCHFFSFNFYFCVYLLLILTNIFLYCHFSVSFSLRLHYFFHWEDTTSSSFILIDRFRRITAVNPFLYPFVSFDLFLSTFLFLLPLILLFLSSAILLRLPPPTLRSRIRSLPSSYTPSFSLPLSISLSLSASSQLAKRLR